ncbi:Uncharacterised protein [Klebsiella pneumoniae]|nr:Uncharacterised protein [Klebsiella pneumoniae]
MLTIKQFNLCIHREARDAYACIAELLELNF